MATLAEIRQQYPQYSDMSDRDLASALHSKFYADMPREQFDQKIGLAAQETGSVLSDVAKSSGVGLAKGAIGIAGLPGDIGSLVSAGLGKLGVPEQARQAGASVIKKIPGAAAFTGPGSGDIQKTVEGYTGEFYKPQTTAGKYAQTVGEFAPAAALGPASIARRVGMQVAAPALASEFAGQQTSGTAAEPYARIAAAVAAPGVASKTGSALVDALGALGPGTGGQSVRTAFASGVRGGEAGQAFRDNMRGAVPLDDVVTDAKTAVQNMRSDRSTGYNQGLASMRAAEAGPYPSAAPLKFDDIDKAVSGTNQVKNFKGIDLSPETAGVRKQVSDVIDQWKALNPLEYHTPLGMDALKQRIGSIKDSLPFNTPERLVAERAYSAVRDTIVKQAPDYAKTMKGYERASTQIGEIEKALSLGKKASVDTALRKLQSVTRNNVNTNYGKRAELAEVLSKHGAPNLMEGLAGQSMNAWTPRGLNKVSASIPAALAWFNPMTLAALPAMSPRLVGEAAHAAGRVAGTVPKAEEMARALLGFSPPKKIDRKRAALISALNAEQSVPQ